jgi:hypothetical protein
LLAAAPFLRTGPVFIKNKNEHTAWTAKSGDFEVADSSCLFRGIGHFLGESATSEYIMSRTSYRNGRNTEALIFENLKPVEIIKKSFEHHLNILKNV